MICQVVFRDQALNLVFGGIRLDNGDIICAHCGHLISNNDIGDDRRFQLLEGFDSWLGFSDVVRRGETWQIAEENRRRVSRYLT